MTVKSMQHFTEQAQTELAINLLTEKMPKGKRSNVWLYFAQKDPNNATCRKRNKTIACRGGEKARVKSRSATAGDASKTKPSILKGQYKFTYSVCSNNKIEKIGINKS